MSGRIVSVLLFLAMWAGVGIFQVAQLVGLVDVTMPYHAAPAEDQTYQPRRK